MHKKLKKDFLILLSPNFKQIGCDLAEEYLLNNPNSKVNAICHGPLEVYLDIKKKYKKTFNKIWDIGSEDKNWNLINRKFDLGYIDKKMGLGYLGRALSSDRAIGYGFVRGANPRENKLKDRIKKNPIFYGSNYIAYLIEFIEKVLDETQPKVVFSYAVASAVTIVLADLCKKKNIVFTTIKATRIEDYFFIDTHYNARFLEIEKEFLKTKSSPYNLKQSKIIFNNFIEFPEMPAYQKTKIKYIKKNSNIIPLLKFIKNLLKFIFLYFSRNEYEFLRVKRSFAEFQISLNKMLVKRKLFTNHIPSNGKYVYFGLQVEPEASTSIFSPFHTDQLSIIEALAKSVPSDMLILVKENIYMLGRRPSNYYSIIKNMPRVILLAPEIEGIEVVKKSSIIATISGTSAWEALLLKKKVLILGDSPYLCFKTSIIKEDTFSKYSESINKLIEMKILPESEIIKFIDCILKKSFKMDSGLIWRGDYNSFSKHQKKDAVKNILRGILDIVNIK